MHICCYHLSPDAITVFEAARPDGCHLVHHVDARIARQAGPQLDAGLRAELALRLDRLAGSADAVLVTDCRLGTATTPKTMTAAHLLGRALEARASERGSWPNRVEVLYTDSRAGPALATQMHALSVMSDLTLTHVPAAEAMLRAGDVDGQATALRRAVASSSACLLAVADPVTLPDIDRGRPVLALAPSALAWLVANHGPTATGIGA